MTLMVTLELPETVATRAKEIADQTQRRLEEVLVEWLNRAITEPPIELLSDKQVLALCNLQMEPKQNEELSQLLAHNQEGALTKGETIRLDELMQIYRRGLVRKGQALKVAVERGLRPPVDGQQ